VVFLHELSHALATWVTCGKVISMEVHGNEGGLTKTVGGSRFIILSSGYLGSFLWEWLAWLHLLIMLVFK